LKLTVYTEEKNADGIILTASMHWLIITIK